MKYYKNAENQTDTADRPEHEALIPVGYTEITKDRYDALNASVTKKTQAQALLSASDITVLRCYENSVPLPASWVMYRKELRNIISGTSIAGTIPTRPAYPGTK